MLGILSSRFSFIEQNLSPRRVSLFFVSHVRGQSSGQEVMACPHRVACVSTCRIESYSAPLYTFLNFVIMSLQVVNEFDLKRAPMSLTTSCVVLRSLMLQRLGQSVERKRRACRDIQGRLGRLNLETKMECCSCDQKIREEFAPVTS